MAEQVTLFRVFLSSSEELSEDREAAASAIKRWNIATGKMLGFRLEDVTWKSHSTPEVGRPPQAIINERLLDSSDIVIGLIWTCLRIGTEEELRRSIDRGKPVLIYFCDRPIAPSRLNSEAVRKVGRFKDQLADKCLYGTYSDFNDLQQQLQPHLTDTIVYLSEQRGNFVGGVSTTSSRAQSLSEIARFRKELEHRKIPQLSSARDRALQEIEKFRTVLQQNKR